jgi:hypothetical protein
MLRRLLLGCVSVALLAPATAVAHAKVTFIPPFRIAGTNGYRVEMYAEVDRRYGPSVSISFWNRTSQTTYVAPGRINADGFSASFGHFGWVDIHYEPGKPRLVKDCRGRKRKEGDGRFTGTIEFHGEAHFSEADYPWFEARQISQYESICWVVGEGGAKGASLTGLSRYGTTHASANGKGGRVRFQATAQNKLGSLRIYRSLQAFGPQKDFVWSPRLTSARVTPPEPFHGSASFHLRKEKGNFELGRWRGDLTVDFPGFRAYPLAARPTLGIIQPGGCKVRSSHRPRPPVICL